MISWLGGFRALRYVAAFAAAFDAAVGAVAAVVVVFVVDQGARLTVVGGISYMLAPVVWVLTHVCVCAFSGCCCCTVGMTQSFEV